MTASIERFATTAVITAGSSANTLTPRFPFDRWAGGGVLIGATNSATQINWHASIGPESTPLQIRSDGSAVTTAVTDGAHPIPDACFGFPYIAPVIVGATTCAMTVTLKG
jgi:hypothetical protein